MGSANAMSPEMRSSAKRMVVACAALAGALAAALVGIFLLPDHRIIFLSIECYMLACSEIALGWLALRAARRVRRVSLVCATPTVLSGLCVIAHLSRFPWTMFFKVLEANPFRQLALFSVLLFAPWSLLVWMALMVGVGARLLRGTPEAHEDGASRRERGASLSLRDLGLGLAPAAFVFVMLGAHLLHVRVQERVIVSRHPEARVVREYLDALVEGDYLEMSRKLMVLRVFAQTGRGRWLPSIHPEDFEGRIDLQEEFAADCCRELAKELNVWFFPSTARILEARQFFMYECEGEQEPTSLRLAGWQEVVVEVRYRDGNWTRQYFVVRAEGYDEPRIWRSCLAPQAKPEGCSPVPWLAKYLRYDTPAKDPDLAEGPLVPGVVAWGDDRRVLGCGQRLYLPGSVVQVQYLTDVAAVEADFCYSLALRKDGTVWAWGRNERGQLGDGTREDSGVPVQVGGLTDVKAIAAGGHHALALQADGTVGTWGDDGYSTALVPREVDGLTQVTGIAAGGHHSLAVLQDGTVWAWGSNYKGQIGDGRGEGGVADFRPEPVQVKGITETKAVAAEGHYSLALKADGTVWAWGSNAEGQLGQGLRVKRRNTPVRIEGLTGVISVAAGGGHALALERDGTVWAWGSDLHEQLGDGKDASDFEEPAERILPDFVPQRFPSPDRNKIVLEPLFTTELCPYAPVRVKGLTNVTAIAAGYHYSLALESDGTVWGWGRNRHYVLGSEANDTEPFPIQIPRLSQIKAIAAGDTHCLAVKE